MYSLCFKLFSICSYENCAKKPFRSTFSQIIKPDCVPLTRTHTQSHGCNSLFPPVKKRVPFRRFYMCNFSRIHELLHPSSVFPTFVSPLLFFWTPQRECFLLRHLNNMETLGLVCGAPSAGTTDEEELRSFIFS